MCQLGHICFISIIEALEVKRSREFTANIYDFETLPHFIGIWELGMCHSDVIMRNKKAANKRSKRTIICHIIEQRTKVEQ